MANAYMSVLDSLHHTEVCPISLDEMYECRKYLRGSIQIRNEDDRGSVKPPCEYNSESLFNAIRFKKEDPLTRRRFSQVEINRIIFYYQAYLLRVERETFSPVEVYTQFKEYLTSPESFTPSQIGVIIDNVKYFLQMEDFIDMFKSFSGDGSLLNRDAAYSYLEDKPVGSWLVRKSSAIDDTYDKFYAITIRRESGYSNSLFLHKIGKGIYMCDLAPRSATRSDVVLGKGYSCFYDLITYHGLDWLKSI